MNKIARVNPKRCNGLALLVVQYPQTALTLLPMDEHFGKKPEVVYGSKFCYVNIDQPTRSMKKIIEEQGPMVRRIQATHCVDMLAPMVSFIEEASGTWDENLPCCSFSL